MEEVIHKYVNDLGIAAFLIMYGNEVVGKHGRSIYFRCEDKAAADAFDDLVLDYQPPNEFYTFDSCLMYIKKMNEQMPRNCDESTTKIVTDLGAAAYLLMLECDVQSRLKIRIEGKRGRNVYFSHPEGKGAEFDRRSYRYLSSPFQTYDANLMALKKIGEYMPDK